MRLVQKRSACFSLFVYLLTIALFAAPWAVQRAVAADATATHQGIASPTALSPTNFLSQILEQELARNYNGKPAGLAHAAYCKCPKAVASSGNLCNKLTSQCRSSFCMPICTRMAWQPRIEVHCERAPDWKWCPAFAKQVVEAETAVTAQFQAHTCLQMGFCNKTEEFIDWVENHTFGTSYPNHRLPIQACQVPGSEAGKSDPLGLNDKSKRRGKSGPKTTADLAREAIRRAAEDALKRTSLPSQAGKKRQSPSSSDTQVSATTSGMSEEDRTRIQASLCGACQAVVDVSIVRGTCIPGGASKTDMTILQEGSLHDRCLFVADMIGARSMALLRDLKQSVCNCLGCCGSGTCYFPNVEKQWLTSLISNVQAKLTKELSIEGWKDEL